MLNDQIDIVAELLRGTQLPHRASSPAASTPARCRSSCPTAPSSRSRRPRQPGAARRVPAARGRGADRPHHHRRRARRAGRRAASEWSPAGRCRSTSAPSPSTPPHRCGRPTQVVHTLVVGLWIARAGVRRCCGAGDVVAHRASAAAGRSGCGARSTPSRVAGTDQRLSAEQRAAELDQLAGTLNGMLDRISASEAIRRQFLADASHELRSPLASARTMLEVGLAYPDRTDWPGTAEEVMVEVDRLQGWPANCWRWRGPKAASERCSVQTVDLGSARRGRECSGAPTPRVDASARGPAWVSADRHAGGAGACATCSTTPAGTPRTKVTVNVSSGDAWRRCRCTTTATRSPSSERETHLRAVHPPRQRRAPATTAAPASACRSPAASPRCTAARSRSSTPPTAAAFLLSLPAP